MADDSRQHFELFGSGFPTLIQHAILLQNKGIFVIGLMNSNSDKTGATQSNARES